METPKTTQEIFDKVVTHLRQQGVQSRTTTNSSGKSSCLYRCGCLMCAVGCLIPNRDYSPKMESNDVQALLKKNLLPKELHTFFEENVALLSSLQHIHDAVFPEHWEKKFQEAAGKFSLIYTPKS